MGRSVSQLAMASLGLCTILAGTIHAQGFGSTKDKVTLHRKLPALIHLTGGSIKVSIPGQEMNGDVSYDLQSLLETELLKDDPDLHVDNDHPDITLICNITGYFHPEPTVTTRPAVGITGLQDQQFTRVTGSLAVSFQVKNARGQQLIADNVEAKYDQEFDAMGNSTSKGVKGSFTGTFKRLKGGSSEEMNAPSDSELRSKLLLDAVQQIAEHVVNTNESVDVLLARAKGPIDDGIKAAEAGLWERAQETFETAPQLGKPEDDAYRLYDIGVAYEALAYQTDDAKIAMKNLDQAAINYGKAVDAKPSEKYFLAPQKRIETAIAHYKDLEDQLKPKPVPVQVAAPTPAAPGTPKGLSNTQVLAMIKSGMDVDTVIQAIKAAKTVQFDLTPAGQQGLTSGGASPAVVTAMKVRAARKTTTAASPKPATASAHPAAH